MSIIIDYTAGSFNASPSGETVGSIAGNATLDLTSGNVFNHTPTAATTFVFSNPPSSGTAQGLTLKITGASVPVGGYDLANVSSDSKSLTLSDPGNYHGQNFFKPDGTKVYITSYAGFYAGGNAVREFDLSTAWDISTASYNNSILTSFPAGTGNYIMGMAWKSDGSALYLTTASDTVLYYSVATAWDLSSATYSSTFTDSTNLTSPGSGLGAIGLFFKTDGTSMFVVDTTLNKILQYTLSTAWDISTASYASKFLSVSSHTINVSKMLSFDPTGTKMFYGGGDYYQYTLATAWDVSTASYDSVSFISGDYKFSGGFSFGDSGTKMYFSYDDGFNTGNFLRQYSSPSLGQATFTYPSSVDWAGGTAPTAPAIGATDVLTFYTTDGGTTYYGFLAGGAMA